jgi:hypothetical protein
MKPLLSTLLLLFAACSTPSTSSTTAMGTPTATPTETTAWPTCCGTTAPADVDAADDDADDDDGADDGPSGCCTCCDPGTCCDLDEDVQPQCGEHGCMCRQQPVPHR